MAGEQNTVWDLDPHTRAKQIILRKYLNAWLPKLTRWNGRVVICDGFAGPGIYSKGEEGSPVIALKAFLEHSYQAQMKGEIRYIFIEADRARCARLDQVVSAIKVPKSVDVTIFNETCETALNHLLDFLDEKRSQLAPTFAFIDPFGITGIPLEMIARLMAHGKCEVLITFMLSALHRFISTPEFEGPSDRLFGSGDWRFALEMEGQERESFLRTLYQGQLETVVGAEYVRFFTMKDSRDRTIYDLFFATNSSSGIDAMKYAMWRVDPAGGYSFSDATDPNQETLFTAEPNWEQLFDGLCERFRGTAQPWPVVEEAIRDSAFRIMKRPFKAAAQSESPRFRIINPRGARQGTLDNRTVVHFSK